MLYTFSRTANLRQLVPPHVHPSPDQHTPQPLVLCFLLVGPLVLSLRIERLPHITLTRRRKVGRELDVEVDDEFAPAIRIVDQRQTLAWNSLHVVRPGRMEFRVFTFFVHTIVVVMVVQGWFWRMFSFYYLIYGTL